MKCIKLTLLILLALLISAIVPLQMCDAQSQEVAETVKTAQFTITPATEPQRTYFDVPLSHDVQDQIFTECEKHNIRPSVVIAMIERESNFNQYCIGDDGRSAGLMQIQAKWHIKRMIALDCTDLFNPQENITVGTDYLAELMSKYGSIDKALTAYNRGSYSGTVTEYAVNILRKAGELQ